MSKNITALSGRKGLTDNLFEQMGVLTEKDGSLTDDDAKKLAEEYLVGDASVYGAATFYDLQGRKTRAKKSLSAMERRVCALVRRIN